MRTMTYTDARNRLAQALDSVERDHAPIVITRQKGAPAVLMSMEDFASWQETEYLLRTPANAAQLARAMRDLEAGKAVRFNPLGRASSGRRRRTGTTSAGAGLRPRLRRGSTR